MPGSAWSSSTSVSPADSNVITSSRYPPRHHDGHRHRPEMPLDPGHLKDQVQHVDPFRMRRMVAGGLGVAALAWALGSSDWRRHWSEFWTTARTQIGATDAVTYDRVSSPTPR